MKHMQINLIPKGYKKISLRKHLRPSFIKVWLLAALVAVGAHTYINLELSPKLAYDQFELSISLLDRLANNSFDTGEWSKVMVSPTNFGYKIPAKISYENPRGEYGTVLSNSDSISQNSTSPRVLSVTNYIVGDSFIDQNYLDKLVLQSIQKVLEAGWLTATPATPAISAPAQQYAPISYIQSNPQTNLSGASLFSATDLSSQRLYTDDATIADQLNVAGDTILQGNLTVTGTCTGCGGGGGTFDAIGDAVAVGDIANAAYSQTWGWDALTTGTALAIGSSSATTGTVLGVASTGTAALTGNKALSVSQSGANAVGAQTTYGLYSTNTRTGTSNNVAGYFSATGGTNNYAAIFENGNVGIGTTAPSARLDVSGTDIGVVYTSGFGQTFNVVQKVDNTITTDPATDFAASLLSGISMNIASGTVSGTQVFGLFGTVATTATDGATYDSTSPFNGVLGISNLQGTGSVNMAVGGNFGVVRTGTGVVTNMRGINVQNQNYVGTSTIADVRGINIQQPVHAGGSTMTNIYGLYLENQTPAAGTVTNTPFGIYQAGSANYNYFAGNVGIGTTAPVTTFDVRGTIAGLRDITGTDLLTDRYTSLDNVTAAFQINAGVQYGMAYSAAGNNTFAMWQEYIKTRSIDGNTAAIVQNGDELGRFNFYGDDGVGIESEGARITIAVDGTPGVDDMPGRIVFSTTPDGSSEAIERLRINNAGNVGIGTTTPQGKLDISGTDIGVNYTTPFGQLIKNVQRISNIITIDPATDYATGLFVGPNMNIASGTVSGTQISGILMNGGTDLTDGATYDNTSPIMGIYSASTLLGTGSVDTASGGTFNVIRANTGVVTNMRGVNVQNINYVGVGTIADVRGVNIQQPVHAGGSTMTNIYGLYLENQTPAAGTVTNTPFGVYQAGSANYNYFAGNTGIGATSPSAKLQVVDNVTGFSSTNAVAKISGTGGAYGLITETAGVAQYSARSTSHTDRELRFQLYSDGNVYFSNALFSGTAAANLIIATGEDSGTNTGEIRISPGGSQSAVFANNGNVGIGDTSPDTKLDVEGDAATAYIATFFNDGNNANRYGVEIQGGADDGSGTTYYLNALDGDGTQVGYLANTTGTFALTDVSDVRTKTNIVNTEIDAMEILTGLRVVDFNRISNPNGAVITGFIAQEVQEIYPKIVTEGENGYLGITKENLIPVLVKGFQEQQARIDSLQASINMLQGNSDGNLPADSPLVLASHLYLSGDSVGEAKILAGSTSVRVSFAQQYEYQPIITATPGSKIGSEYWIADRDSYGFTIYIDLASNQDIIFNWHSFAGEAAKLTVSDGTLLDIPLVVAIPSVSPPYVEEQVLGEYEEEIIPDDLEIELIP